MKRLIMFSLLVSALIRSAWAIDPRAIDVYEPLIKSIILNDAKGIEAAKATLGENKDFNGVYVFDAASNLVGMYDDLEENEIPEGSVGVSYFIGPITKYDSSLRYGTKSRVAMMKELAGHENIKALVNVVDGPGGSVDGTKEAADFIKSIEKPVVTFIDGMAASASYWIASAGDEVYANIETAEIGSIGTMVRLTDWSGYDEKNGIKEHIIYATKSKDKNRDYHDALEGKYSSIIKNQLDPLNEIFIESVKANRPNASEDVYSGKMYLAEEASDKGLIDGIKTFEQAIERAAELANDFKVTVG